MGHGNYYVWDVYILTGLMKYSYDNYQDKYDGTYKSKLIGQNAPHCENHTITILKNWV